MDPPSPSIYRIREMKERIVVRFEESVFPLIRIPSGIFEIPKQK